MANHTTDKALMRRVKSAGTRLTRTALWSTNTSLNLANSFLLEMYLLFRIVQDLKSAYTVTYDKGASPHEHEFPQNGAPKAGRPKFIVKDKASGTVLFQICAGTTAADIHNHDRALDISIQKATATDSPTSNDVLQVFDAKYRTTFSDRLSHHEFSEFARWIELFGLRGAGTPAIQFGSMHDFDANCLVTNGQPSTELDAECNRTAVREITKFHPTKKYASRP